jgi:hypothetical protein
MQLPLTNEKPPVGIIFDCDMAQIDDALALSLMFGLDGKREARVASMSISRPSLKAAAFSDAVARFYAGAAVQFMRMLPVGMELKGPAPGAEPMLDGPLAKPEYKHTIHAMNDTADPAALIRNALTAHHDGNCLAILAGAATNFTKALMLPGVQELVARKLRFLTVVPDSADLADTNKLLSDWPGSVVVVDPSIGDQLLYPASSIETGFAWTQAHPVVDAYKSYKAMPYDAPTATLAAVLHAVRPHEGYFKLSEPGSITVLEGGKLKLAPSPQGKHRQLIYDPAQKERILKTYTEIVSAKPVPRIPRFRQQQQQQQEDKPKAPEAKPAAADPRPATP